MKALITLVIVLTFVGTNTAQESKSVLITGGHLHLGNGESIITGAVGVRDGKIVFAKNSLTFTVDRSKWDTIIDVSGKHIYPGFIAPNSTLGLT